MAHSQHHSREWLCLLKDIIPKTNKYDTLHYHYVLHKGIILTKDLEDVFERLSKEQLRVFLTLEMCGDV